MYQRTGFTLLDMMVVVIIIGVLVLIAVPQYKHAVLKSRFSALSPIAQHLKTAQEAYYIGNDYYSEDLNTLDLDVPGTITSATTASYGDNMRAKISSQEEEEAEYSYVLTSKEGLNNNYIMYQEHSKNYPGEVHCEAKNGDSYAQWLCEKGLSGQKIEKGSITPGYTTYIISGSGNGTFSKACEEEKELEDDSCACGKKTRTVTGCNEDTGKWIYSNWSECPVKPEETKSCSALDPKWTSGTATRTSQCQGGSWTEPAWDDTACERECDSTQEYIHTTCAENCGEEIKRGTCNRKTGQWENYTVTQACPEKPSEELNCDNGVSGKMTRTSQCQGNTWTEPTWDKSACCDPNNKPAEEYICHDNDANTCGIRTRTVSCGTDGQWVDDENAWQGSCEPVETIVETIDCGSSYSNSTAQPTRTATCKADGTWEYGSYDYTACGCTISTKPADYTYGCEESGKTGTKTYTYACNSSNQWTSQLKSSNCTTVPAGGTYSGSGNRCYSFSGNTCNGSYTFTQKATCSVGNVDNTCNGNTYTEGASCYAGSSSRTNTCNGGTFEGRFVESNGYSPAQCQGYGQNTCSSATFNEYSTCLGYGSGACTNNTFNSGSYCNAMSSGGCTGNTFKTGTSCWAQKAESCTGNTFKTGAYCWAQKAGACANNTYEGTACCYATSTGLCPSGSRKCNSSHVWDNTYW